MDSENEQSKKGKISVTFTKRVVDRMRKERILTDQMGTVAIVLVGLFNDELDFLDLLDEQNKDKRLVTLLKQMQHHNMLQPAEENLFRLTHKGTEMATLILEETDKQLVKIITVQEETGEVVELKDTKEPEDWVREYCKIFPTTNGHNRGVRMHSAVARTKMKVFQDQYGYNQETILAAARLYIQEQLDSPEGHMFTVNTNNFIGKHKTDHPEHNSMLAAYCARVLEEKESPKQQFDSKFMDTA